MLLNFIVLTVFILSWVVFVELEKFVWATASIAAFLGLLGTFDIFNVLTFVKGGLSLVAFKWVGLYLLAGVLWSVGKWVFYNYQLRDEYRKVKNRFLRKKNVTEITEEVYNGFQDALTSYYHSGLPRKFHGNKFVVDMKNNLPQLSDNKARVTSWAIYWPVSMVGTLLNDPIRRLVNFVVERLEMVYARISQHVFRND